MNQPPSVHIESQVSDQQAIRRIYRAWWPLAASWLLMGVEIPAISAVIARLPDAPVHLAAFGGVVYPLALVIESPIIMLLSASTALCKDWNSYKKVWSFMMWAGGILTAAHLLIVATPAYYFVVDKLIQVGQLFRGYCLCCAALGLPSTKWWLQCWTGLEWHEACADSRCCYVVSPALFFCFSRPRRLVSGGSGYFRHCHKIWLIWRGLDCGWSCCCRL